MDFITGDKFIGIADWTYSPAEKQKGDYDNLPNTLNLSSLNDMDVVYTHTIYIKQLFELLKCTKKKIVLITHNGDVNIGNPCSKPKNIVRWYTQNLNSICPFVYSIPIGLENNRWFKKERKKEKMIIKSEQPKQFKNLLYLNYNINTNPMERTAPYNLLCDQSWVTARKGANGSAFDDYLDNIYNHKFVLCPEGNGLDTHRTWETLYMNSIPIEKRNINNQFYKELPICFVNDWIEITAEFLESEYIRIKSKEWKMEMLTFEYWKNKIKEG
jgi:hypothetical protein